MINSKKKSILFLTGTRADFGKLKPLMDAVENDPHYECRVFVTGMHTLERYGSTVNEVRAGNYEHLHVFMNQIIDEPMDLVFANTVQGLARYVHDSTPDAVVVHGDRVEALAGAVVGSLRNIPTAHIEGGELSGTIDELIRHAVSKMSHVHFVANDEAASRLVQMGEMDDSIHVIGSPDIDVMLSPDLPSIDEVKRYYEIPFPTHAIACYHPVTTELDRLDDHVEQVVQAIEQSNQNFVLIYPNNDEGANIIFRKLKRLESNPRVRMLPSLRFEYFLSLLRSAQFILGNSSAAIREAPVYGVPAVNVGSRQRNRFVHCSILDVAPDCDAILATIQRALEMGRQSPSLHFGRGDSAQQFLDVVHRGGLWSARTQKQFTDLGETLIALSSRPRARTA